MNNEEQFKSLNKRFAFGLIIIIFLVTFGSLFFIHNHSLIAHDESLYGSRARLILENNDWFTPFEKAHHKTVGSYWPTAVSLKILGINEFSARLPSYIFSISAQLVLFTIIKFLSNYQIALISVFSLQSSYLWFSYSNYCSPDTLYILLNLLGILHLLKINQFSKDGINNRNLFFSGLFFALPFFVRSYMQLLPLISISPLILLKFKRLNFRNYRYFLFGLLAGLLPLMIFYYLSLRTYGFESLIRPFMLLKTKTFSENDIFEGFIFYPRNLILFCVPFFIFIFNGSKYIYKNMSSEVKILFIFSPLINVLLLMLTASKYSHYGLFTIPLLASNASFGIYECFKNNSFSSKLTLRFFGGFNLIICSTILLSFFFRSKFEIFNSFTLIELSLICIFLLISIYFSLTLLFKANLTRLNFNKIISIFSIQIIFLALLFANGIIGNPNNDFKYFLNNSAVNEIINKNRIFLIGKLDDKLLHLLKFYLPKYKKIEIGDVNTEEIIYGIISDSEVSKLDNVEKYSFSTIQEFKNINLVKIN